MDNFCKRSNDFVIAIFTQHHIVSAASPNTDTAGEIVFVLFQQRTDTSVAHLVESSRYRKRAPICLIQRN